MALQLNLSDLAAFKGIIHKGHSEIWTPSIQQTGNVPLNDYSIEIINFRDTHNLLSPNNLLFPDNEQKTCLQRTST